MVSLSHLPQPTAEACGLQTGRFSVVPERKVGRMRKEKRIRILATLCSLPTLPNTAGAGEDLLCTARSRHT